MEMKKGFRVCILITFLISGCSELSVSPTITPTQIPESIETVTTTINWFPTTPTFTPTKVPTLAPTPEMKPGLGAIFYEDDFSNHTLWNTSSSVDGSVAYGAKELTIAIKKTKTTMISQANDVKVDNFYLEITAYPSLCTVNDVYGILFRYNTRYDYYRLLISCAGEMRLERVRQATTTILQDWILSGQIPPGAPMMVRLGIWADGDQIRIFANDIFQFGTTDETFSSGGIAIYARSSSNNALTVNYRDLVIRNVWMKTNPTVTIIPTKITPVQNTKTPSPSVIKLTETPTQ
jgi:hypothetical protein